MSLDVDMDMDMDGMVSTLGENRARDGFFFSAARGSFRIPAGELLVKCPLAARGARDV